MIFTCPGSQKFKQPYPEVFKCSGCGSEVEVWTDEIKGVCSGCGSFVSPGERQSCLKWCKNAWECAGYSLSLLKINNMVK